MKIGLGISGSFCSFSKVLIVLKQLLEANYDVYVFMSDHAKNIDTRFYEAKHYVSLIEKMIGKAIIDDIVEAERFGPQIQLDALIIYPCSSNTLAKLVYGITDNALTMACKATLRHLHPIILGICSNDALSTSGKNIMQAYNTKNFYLIPMYQDDIIHKPNSLIAREDYVLKTLDCALKGKQIQPLFLQL